MCDECRKKKAVALGRSRAARTLVVDLLAIGKLLAAGKKENVIDVLSRSHCNLLLFLILVLHKR